MTRRPREVRIDRLVLPAGTVGVARVREAVARELARAMRLAGPGQNIDIPSLDARLDRAPGPGSVGRAVAEAIVRRRERS